MIAHELFGVEPLSLDLGLQICKPDIHHLLEVPEKGEGQLLSFFGLIESRLLGKQTHQSLKSLFYEFPSRLLVTNSHLFFSQLPDPFLRGCLRRDQHPGHKQIMLKALVSTFNELYLYIISHYWPFCQRGNS